MMLRNLINRSRSRHRSPVAAPPAASANIARVIARSAPAPLPDPAPAPTPASAPPAAARLPSNLIKTSLDAHDRAPEQSRLGDSDYLHVSSLIGLCPRQYVLARQANAPLFNSLTGGHRVMFATGRAVERYVREAYFTHHGTAGALGSLTCACGETTVSTATEGSEVCPTCRRPCTDYRELVLRDDDARIMGSPDLPIITEGGAIAVVEIKSMTKNQFDPLSAALGDHIFQALAYRRLFALDGLPVADYVSILYVNKQFQFGSPYKEFIIDATAPEHDRMLDTAWQSARVVKRALATGRLPERTLCASLSDRRARDCPVVTPCFSRS